MKDIHKTITRGLQAHPQTCTIDMAVTMHFKPITDGEPQVLSMHSLLPTVHPTLLLLWPP